MNGRLELLSSTLLVDKQARSRLVHHDGGTHASIILDSPRISVPKSSSAEISAFSDITSDIQRPRKPEALPLQARTKSSWTSIDAGLARLNLQYYTTTFHDPDKEEDDEGNPIPTNKTFTVNFLFGFSSCRRGFRLSTRNCIDWMTLNVVRRRPGDSQILALCRQGDTMGVQKLLHSGEASLFDTDEEGYGLLHVSESHAVQ